MLRNFAKRQVRALFPRGIGEHIKLARLAIARRGPVHRVDVREFAEGLQSLGDWRGRTVWVQASWNDMFSLDMRPREVIDLMLELVGPEGTLAMPAFPVFPDRTKVLAIDAAPTTTGLLSEIVRRMPGAERSVHATASIAAIGPQARYLTEAHHLDIYPWGRETPYGRLYQQDALMVGLGIVSLGLTPLHMVECELHHQVPRFRKIFGTPFTYAWRRRNGETGTHTTYVRYGTIRPGRLSKYLPEGMHRQGRLSNFSIQSAPARGTIDALKGLAARGKTIYAML